MTDYKSIADAASVYPDADAAFAVMSADTTQAEKPINSRMINERTVFSLIGMAAGEAFMATLESDSSIPSRVKAWFKPSELGVDVLDPSSRAIIAAMVGGGVITQVQGYALSSYGYTNNPVWPGLKLGYVVDALKKRASGEI